MKKAWKGIVKFFDTWPEVFSERCIKILENTEDSRELMVAIENDQNHPNTNSPYSIYSTKNLLKLKKPLT